VEIELEKWLERFRREGIKVKGERLQAGEWVNERKKAYEKYRSKFLNIDSLTKEEMKDFLSFDSNRSWTGLGRKGVGALKDFERFKKTLEFLLDESFDVEERIQKVVDTKEDFHVPGMGRNLATAILHVYNPEKYAVYNNAVKKALKKVGRLPPHARGENWGSRYVKVNDELKKIAKEIGTDLVEVDCLMYYILGGEAKPTIVEEIEAPSGAVSEGLEFEETREEEEPIEVEPERRRVYSDKSDRSIYELYQWYKEGDLILQPEFQRLHVWDDGKRSRLVESVLLEVPIPIIYLSEENDGKFSTIDGQQRLNAFFDFLDNNLKLKGLWVLRELKGIFLGIREFLSSRCC